MSHVHVLCTDLTNVLVLKTDKYYRLPDSERDGKLEWSRSDAKRVALRTLRDLFCGLLLDEHLVSVTCEKACFGLQKDRRLVKVVVTHLDVVLPYVNASLGYWKVNRKLKLIQRLDDTLDIETLHIVQEKMCWERGSNPRGNSRGTPEDTETEVLSPPP